MSKTDYETFTQHMRQIADVEYSIAVLSWDKEVNLPPRSAAFRSQQVATLAGIQYEKFMQPAFGELLHRLADTPNGLSEGEKRNVALTLKEYRRMARLDQAFVVRRSQLTSRAYHAWLAAREANDYARFQPALADLLAVKREETEKLGYEDHPYDALLEEYEPGCRTNTLDRLFRDVREQLVAFARQVREQPQVDDRFLQQHYPREKQWEWGLYLLRQMGFDFDRGRQDLSPHPFTIHFSSEDVRVTTRIDERDLANLTWSCIHEGGHALYEQGLPPEAYGLPLGRHVSLGIHESQSRLWENHVGRSRTFWQAFLPRLREFFPGQLNGVSLEDFYRGVNKVEPSLIRTESDELHYHLHILIRYELEKALFEGSLDTPDLKDAWQAQYQAYFDLEAPDDRRGILQDIHWAHGSFGYFPTYSLGSFYAAQFYEQAQRDLPGLEEQIAAGDLGALLSWLREKVHRHGRYYPAEDLCERITGERLNPEPFLRYARRKFGEIYGLKASA